MAVMRLVVLGLLCVTLAYSPAAHAKEVEGQLNTVHLAREMFAFLSPSPGGTTASLVHAQSALGQEGFLGATGVRLRCAPSGEHVLTFDFREVATVRSVAWSTDGSSSAVLSRLDVLREQLVRSQTVEHLAQTTSERLRDRVSCELEVAILCAATRHWVQLCSPESSERLSDLCVRSESLLTLCGDLAEGRVLRELADTWAVSAVLDHAQDGVSAERIRKRLGWLVDHRLDGTYSSEVRDLLTHWPSEEEVAWRDAGTGGGTLTPTDLVWVMPGQRGYQSMTPGWPDVFLDERVKNPARALAQQGMRAMPALLVALEDGRPVRVVAQQAHPSGLPVLLRVGDVAGQVLEVITGRRLPRRRMGEETLGCWARVVRRILER